MCSLVTSERIRKSFGMNVITLGWILRRHILHTQMSSFPSEDFSEPLQIWIGDVYLFVSCLLLGLSDMPFQQILIKSINHMVIQLVKEPLACFCEAWRFITAISAPYPESDHSSLHPYIPFIYNPSSLNITQIPYLPQVQVRCMFLQSRRVWLDSVP
jgi:hypothetical protein